MFKTSEVLKKYLVENVAYFRNEWKKWYYIYSRSIEENNVIIEVSLREMIPDKRRKSTRPRTNFIPTVNKYEKMCLQIASRETFSLSLTIAER